MLAAGVREQAAALATVTKTAPSVIIRWRGGRLFLGASRHGPAYALSSLSVLKGSFNN